MDRLNTRVCCGLACAAGMAVLTEQFLGEIVAVIASIGGFLIGFLSTR